VRRDYRSTIYAEGGATVAEPFVFVNTYKVKDGSLEDYKRLSQEVVELVEASEPDMAHFSFYINEETNAVTTLQVHRNAENMAFHMNLVGQHVETSMEYLDFSGMSIDIYGTPTEGLLEQMRHMGGVAVSINGPITGFNRLG
jgi:hypothetical protein